jgi:glycosyltransferase involved in cell wall biosynthesis
MSDEGDRHTTERPQLEARLAELEGRVRSTEQERPPSDESTVAIEAELRVLQEAVDDLASDVLDLHNQLATLVSACERILAGAAGGGLDITLDRGIPSRGSAFVVRRAARRAVRATLGAARRMLGPNDGDKSPVVAVDVRKSDNPATRAVTMSLVVEIAGDPADHAVPAPIVEQTDPELEVVIWNPETGAAVVHRVGSEPETIEAADRSALAAALEVEYIAETTSVPPMIPSLVETCRWAVTSEGLPLFVSRGSGAGEPRLVFKVWRAGRWAGGEDATADVPVVAKLIGATARAAAGPGSGPVVWSEAAGGGRYLLADGASGSVDHRVAVLEGVVSPARPDDDRPHVLLLTPLSGGAVDLVTWLLRGLGDRLRFTVLLTEACDGRQRVVRAMAELTPTVYPMADFLDGSVWPSVAADVIRARDVSSVLRVGTATGIGLPDDPGVAVIDLPLDRSEIDPGAKVVLAVSEGIADAAAECSVEVVGLPAAPGLPPQPPESEQAAVVRSSLGVPEDHRLVVAVSEMVAEQRPEDIAAVAHRLRHRPELHFLLVGDGALAGTVSDIARYFELENFTLAPRTHDLFDLVLAADVVLSTAERDPWSISAAAALALGRHLVVTDVEGRRELVEDWNNDRCVVVQPGDVAGFAFAVEAAVDADRKPRATKKAWKEAVTRSSKSLQLVSDVLDRRSADPKGES